MSENLIPYDFRNCKLCGRPDAAPAFPISGATIYACGQCDFHFLDVLDPTTDADKPLTDRAQQYIATRENEGRHLHPLRLELLKYCGLNAGARVLDVGSGIGQFPALLTEHGLDCLGIEPSTLRRQYAEKVSAFQLIPYKLEDPYWQENDHDLFDAITFWDVIEHVNFPRETLAAAARLLKPGGTLLFDTPSRDVLPYKISTTLSSLSGGKISLFLPSFYATEPFGHKQIFTPDQLTDLLVTLGFEITHLAKSYRNRKKGDKIILAANKRLEPPR